MKNAAKAIIIILIELAVIAGVIFGCVQTFPDKGTVSQEATEQVESEENTDEADLEAETVEKGEDAETAAE